MSSISKKGNRGTSRIAGRPSIHNHDSNCPFWDYENMGRYGLSTNKSHDHGTCSTPQEGTDEVDNVMSKLARASSPMTIRKINVRRNSFNASKQQNDSDDSDEDSSILSKSSPAILSPYSCCSEEAEGVNSSNFTNESRNSSFPNRLNESGTNSIHNTSQNVRRHADISNRNIQYESKKDSKKLLLGSIIIVAIVAIAVAYNNLLKSKEDKTDIIYDKLRFYNDIEGVGNKYKVNDNSILQVRAGIAAIFERQDTGSFIFTYNSGKRNFNAVTFNNFVNDLASTAARYLRNHTKTVRHVVVDTSNLQVKSDKELMDEYVEDVDKTGVMLVKDLDRISSAVAMAFHYYCDEYNPLVKRSAIFFTLNMANCSNLSSEKYSHQMIENCLAEKWVKMPQDNIRPLLTRVVNVVVDVTSDF